MARSIIINPFKYIKRYLPQKLFGRTLTILLTPTIIVMLVITFVFFDRHWSSVTKRFADSIAGDVVAVIHLLQNKDNTFESVKSFAKSNFEMDVSIGRKLEQYTPSSAIFRELGADYLSSSLSHYISTPYNVSLDSDYIYISVAQPDHVLNFLLNRKRLLTNSTTVFLIWLFAAPLLLLIIAVIFLRNQIRPILRLAKAVDNFGKGKDVSNFRPEGAAEVRKAAVAFNQMRERIRRQITQRTEMLAGVSHDLRTPLTRMKLQIAMIEDKATKVGLLKDVDDMVCMVEAFLEFAKNNESEKSQYIRIRKLLLEIIEGYQLESYINLSRDLKIPLRKNHFKRAIVNLLNNAQKYANNTMITARITDDYLKIYIDDDGPGIEESKRQEVFQPFYRQDKSRNLDNHGLGLGLSIAQDSIYQHGGTIKLSDSKMGGLKVEISIPL